MPRQVIYRTEFAKAVSDIVDKLTLEQVGIRTNLAGETIRKMKAGKVPEEATIRAFAEGMDVELDNLLVAAGYKEDPRVAPVILKLRSAKHLRQSSIEEIERIVNGYIEQDKKELEEINARKQQNHGE